MKVLMLSNLFPPHYLGGYELTCEMVCREFERRGHEVVVLTSTHGLENSGPVDDALSVHRALRLYRPFDFPPRTLRWQRRRVEAYNGDVTARTIARERPDVVFAWSQLRLTLGPVMAAQDSGVPVVYSFNDEYIAGFRSPRFALTPRALARHVADRWLFPGTGLQNLDFQYATCISQQLKNNLMAKGMPIGNARVIYHGIAIDDFPPKCDMGRVHIPARILYVGQLQPYKGAHTLIDAAHLAAREGAALQVAIVGDGPEAYKRQLKDQAARGEAPVVLMGKVAHSEVAHIYRRHDLFVFPSIWQEPLGQTHLEAMASGTPVISTAHGGQGEFLEEGRNALIFEKENAGQLAQCMLRLIREKGLGKHLAIHARNTVERRFTLQRYASDLEAFLAEVAGGEAETVGALNVSALAR